MLLVSTSRIVSIYTLDKSEPLRLAKNKFAAHGLLGG